MLLQKGDVRITERSEVILSCKKVMSGSPNAVR